MLKKTLITFFSFTFIIICKQLYSLTYDFTGKVETIRKENIITIILKNMPEKEEYLIIQDNVIVGKLKILSIHLNTNNQRSQYRAIAEFSLKRNNYSLHAGTVIGLLKEEPKEEKIFGDLKYIEKTSYKKIIISEKDKREMLLINEGKFVFGSNMGDKDEKPQRIIFLDSYYIDKYEVSNKDYLYYINETNLKPPSSWINGKYKEEEADFPVMVSYHEAVDYAKWAGKRLPTEKEWDKAARGSGLKQYKKQDESYIILEQPVIYPWGNKFEPEKTNSIEFWETKNIGLDKKKLYSKGLLPVYYFKDTGNSAYGVVNMAGNACEWTSSWYKAYTGSSHSDKKFGSQYKVIRGGAWYNSKYKLRTTNREIGGLPNLYTDNIAGFRCVKEPTIKDLVSNP